MKRDIRGDKNPRWNNGASEYPDHSTLKKNRLEALKKTGGKCYVCGERANIVHHTDGLKNNHDISNLMPLCQKCHITSHKSDDMFIAYQKGDQEKPSGSISYIREYGMTMEALATYIGVSRPTILAWHNHPRKKEWLKKLTS